jgi:hypothetical protein
VAQAATPPDPTTVGQTTLSHIELNGVLGTETTVASGGEGVRIKANWKDNNTACPGCQDYVATAFAGNPAAGRIEAQGKFNEKPTGTGEAEMPAPKAPGTYNVAAHFEEGFSCGEGWKASESGSYQVIARVTVAGSCRTGAVTFESSDGEQCYEVPAGVKGVSVKAVGGKGGGGRSFNGASGGFGALVSAQLTVTPGQTLYVEVGSNGCTAGSISISCKEGVFVFGGGGAPAAGGSGGGASDVREKPEAEGEASLLSRLLVAGGGGGGGGEGEGTKGGTGGSGDVKSLGAGGGGERGEAASATVEGGEGGGGATKTEGGIGGKGGSGEGTGTSGKSGRARHWRLCLRWRWRWRRLVWRW